MVIRRFEIYWVKLEPTVGREIKKTRPAVVISPNEVNDALGTILVAPVTSSNRNYPTRIAFELAGRASYIALDQIRAIDKSRLAQRIAVLSECQKVFRCIAEARTK